MPTFEFTSPTLPQIAGNFEDIYEGDLEYYLYVVFHKATNISAPYHNFRHMGHTFWVVYQGCRWYAASNLLTRHQIRMLLIAALFHDMNHKGLIGNDDENIERAIAALNRYILEIDRLYFDEIVAVFKPTRFPHQIPSQDLPLSAQILRDADMSQGLNPVWVQQVVVGLALEMGKDPMELFQMQPGFLQNHVKLETDWANAMYPPSVFEEKIAEAEAYIRILANKEFESIAAAGDTATV